MNAPATKGRLVFVNRYFDPDQSATSQMLTDLARGLARRGFRVHIVCCRQLYTDPDARLAVHEERFAVAVHRVATSRFGRARLLGRALDYVSFYVSAALALLRLVRRGDVVVAKTDPPLISLVSGAIARLMGARAVTWQQDVFPEVATLLGANPLPRWLDALLRTLRTHTCRSASMNVLISQRMLEHFRAFGVPPARLCVIENWADEHAIEPKSAAASALRARLRTRAGFVVCYSGNLGRAHEFATLLSAAVTLREERGILFLMIGGGVNMDLLQAAVAAQGLENFEFMPYQPREALADSLAAADVHLVSLVPALEGYIAPSKLYGIMAAGRPVLFVGDGQGDVGRILHESQCGVSIPVNAGDELVAAIRRLQSDAAFRDVLGKRARAAFLAKYTFDQALARWVAMLEFKPERRVAAAALPEPSD